MKTWYSGIMIYCFLSVLSYSTPGAGQSSTGWEKISENEGVNLFERWIDLSDDLRVKERKGVVHVNVPMENALKVLCDPSRAPEWMNNLCSSFTIRSEGLDHWYSYTAFTLPWPLQDRDLVCVSRLIELQENVKEIRMESRPDAWPEKDGVRRFTKYEAIWTLKENKDGSTWISFAAISFEAPEYPRFILDPIVRNSFTNNLENLRELLESEPNRIAEKGK